jgi:hypothetical protein
LNKRARKGNACFNTSHSPAHRQPARILMIRFVLRFLGLCLLATAFVFFVYDGTKSIANHDFIYTNVGYVWAMIDQNSLNLLQGWLKQKVAWAWDPYMQKIFDLPAWVVVGIAATILILLGRKKKPLIGYGRD